MKKIAPLILLCVLGCRNVPFERFGGKQAEWPTVRNSLHHEKNGVPIFKGLPETRYTIIGTVEGKDISDRALAALAKREHGDAVLILDRHDVTTYHQKGGFAVKNFYIPNHVDEEINQVVTAVIIRFVRVDDVLGPKPVSAPDL